MREIEVRDTILRSSTNSDLVAIGIMQERVLHNEILIRHGKTGILFR